MNESQSGSARSLKGATGFQMIREIDIRNFRCYRQLELAVPGRLNVVVGDNGSGKTSLLEAIFLALCATTQMAIRYRAERGLDGSFNGPARRIEDAIFGDLFYNRDTSKPIRVSLSGDGEDNRTVTIARGSAGTVVPLEEGELGSPSVAPITFRWKSAGGSIFELSPVVTSSGLSFPETGEDLPNFFYLNAGHQISSVEAAQRFSDLGQAGRREDFVRFITSEYSWIKDLAVEVSGGSPVIFATLDSGQRIPLPGVSSGINRVVAMLLMIASRPRSVVLIDEIEIGTHYSHHQTVWAALVRFMREYDSQVFVTTHSKECLEALGAAVASDSSDISLWRVEKGPKTGPRISQFSGKDLVAGLEFGQEVR